MARRAAIARAFAIAPELVLLDEPFVSLDPAMAARSRELLLTTWRARPTAALLAVSYTHLDVYKRQLQDVSGIPGTSARGQVLSERRAFGGCLGTRRR